MVFISLPLLWGLMSVLTFLVAAYGLVVIDVFAAVLSLTGGAILLHQHREAEHRRDMQIIGEENKRKYNVARVARASYYSLQPGEAVLPLRPKADPPRPDKYKYVPGEGVTYVDKYGQPTRGVVVPKFKAGPLSPGDLPQIPHEYHNPFTLEPEDRPRIPPYQSSDL